MAEELILQTFFTCLDLPSLIKDMNLGPDVVELGHVDILFLDLQSLTL